MHFGPGLNVITGESGSGKSVRMGPAISKVAMQQWFHSIRTMRVQMVLASKSTCTSRSGAVTSQCYMCCMKPGFLDLKP